MATIGRVKWVGFVIVPVLLAVFGVAMYLVTRPVDRELDAQERTWASAYESWSTRNAREVAAALDGMGFGTEKTNARLIAPLRKCSAGFTALGEPPELLSSIERLVLEGCGRAEHAVDLNDRFGEASLASIKEHLEAAEERLLLARDTLRAELSGEAGSS